MTRKLEDGGDGDCLLCINGIRYIALKYSHLMIIQYEVVFFHSVTTLVVPFQRECLNVIRTITFPVLLFLCLVIVFSTGINLK